MAEVLAFPGGFNPREVDSMAIEFAAKVRAGHYGKVGFAAIVFECEDGLGLISAGADEQCGYRLIGLLDAAKMSVFSSEDGE